MVLIIILLILCLPLILMLGLYTTTNVVAVVADVPVSGIVLHIDKSDIPEIDIERGESFVLDYTVMPQGATNKGVSYTFVDETTGEEADAFDVQGNVLIPKLPGRFKVTVRTDNGGYSDNFIIYVTTSKVTGLEATVDKDEITVGEYATVTSVITPTNAKNQAVNYTVTSGEGVVEIVNGKIKGVGIGVATVLVSSAENPDIKDEVTVTVRSSGVFDFVNAEEFTTVLETEGDIDVVLNPETALSGYTLELTSDGSFDPYTVMSAVFNADEGKINYEFISSDFVGSITVSLSVTAADGQTEAKSVTVTRITDVKVEWETGLPRSVHFGDRIDPHVNVQPSSADLTFMLTASFTSATDISGEVNSGVQITLTEGKKYTCNGGYVSFMLVGNTVVVYGEKTYDDMSMLERTTTKLYIVVIDNQSGKTVNLPVKTIIVQP